MEGCSGADPDRPVERAPYRPAAERHRVVRRRPRREETGSQWPQKKNAYSASSITVLEGLEAVRKRPGMYIGSTGERGLHHLIWEVVDNAVDEAMAGYATRVEVTLQDDGGVRGRRRRPRHPGRHAPGGEEARPSRWCMTVLHAGGKFDSDSYAVSGGLHGVGVSVVNALSSRARRGDPPRRARLAPALRPLGARPAAQGRGRPSRPAPRSPSGPTATSSRRPTYNLETIRRRLQEMAFLNKGLTIVLRDERNGDAADAEEPDAEGYVAKVKEYVFHYPGGLEDFVAHLNQSKDPIHKKLVVVLRRGATGTRSRSRCSGTPATPSRSTRSRTRSTPTRAAPTRRASAPR